MRVLPNGARRAMGVTATRERAMAPVRAVRSMVVMNNKRSREERDTINFSMAAKKQHLPGQPLL